MKFIIIFLVYIYRFLSHAESKPPKITYLGPTYGVAQGLILGIDDKNKPAYYALKGNEYKLVDQEVLDSAVKSLFARAK